MHTVHSLTCFAAISQVNLNLILLKSAGLKILSDGVYLLNYTGLLGLLLCEVLDRWIVYKTTQYCRHFCLFCLMCSWDRWQIFPVMLRLSANWTRTWNNRRLSWLVSLALCLFCFVNLEVNCRLSQDTETEQHDAFCECTDCSMLLLPLGLHLLLQQWIPMLSLC